MSEVRPALSHEWTASLDFRILGPLVVLDGDGESVEMGSRQQRAVLAVLLLEAGRVVSLDRIIHALWADEAPSSATGTLQAYISQLRRVLEPHPSPRATPSLLLTREPGYLLAARPDQVDARRFGAQAAAGRARLSTGDASGAHAVLAAALDDWRGDPLQDFAHEDFAAAEVARLNEARVAATEDLLDALLALRRNAEAVAVAQRLLEGHPFRERVWGQLMLGLYRDGRQADALAAYRRARTTLDDELGVVPGPELRALEASILRHDPDLTRTATPAVSPRALPGTGPQAALSGTGTPAASAAGPAAVAAEEPGAPIAMAAAEEPGAPIAIPAAGAPGRIVGRDPQLRWISGRVRATVAGKGGLLLVAGLAGIGKTTLVEASVERARAHAMGCAWSRCVEGGATPAFWPWIQILRSLPPRHDVEHVIEVLTGRGETPWRQEDPDTARFHLHESVLGTLRAAAAERPLLLVIEDVHVADASSLLLLGHLAGELRRLPVLVMATMRSEPGEYDPALRQTLGALVDEPGVERIDLQPFGLADIEEYLRAGTASDPDDATVLALLERTGGNPFYLKELLRLLSGEHPDGWGAEQVAAENTVPESVRDVIGRRVSRMPADTQALLRAAAVIGRDIDLTLLEATAGIDDERVMSLLEPAVATGLLVETPKGWDYRFAHALVRDALYAELSRLQRARIHRRVGEALETLHRMDDPAALGLLAHHFGMAARIGAAGKAVEYAVAAAKAARSQLAYEEVAGFFEMALAALDPTTAGAPTERCALLVELGRARRSVGDPLGAREALDEAVALALRLGDHSTVIEAATVFVGITLWNWRPHGYADARTISILEEQLSRQDPADPQRRAVLLSTLGVEMYYSDRREDGVRYAEEAVEIARKTKDPDLRVHTLNNYCIATWEPARQASLLDAVNEILELGPLTPQVELIARMHRMMLLLGYGDLPAYDAELARCRLLITQPQVRMPELAVQLGCISAGRALLDGRWAEGERLLAAAFAPLERVSMSFWGKHWVRLALLQTSRRFQNRPGDLIEELILRSSEPDGKLLQPTAVLAACESGDEALARRLLAQWGAPINTNWWSWDFVAFQWGLIAARLGVPDPGALYDALVPLAGRLMSVGSAGASWGCFHYVLAALAHRLGRTADAVDHARAALAVHRRLGADHLIEASLRQLDTLGDH